MHDFSPTYTSRGIVLDVNQCANKGGDNMKKLITAGLALSAMFAALGEVHAYVNYPWCVVGESRGIECVFTSKEQCAASGRGQGFGSQCQQNPNYNPALGPLGEGGQVKRPVQGRHKLHRHPAS
jgi:hypothetical protein